MSSSSRKRQLDADSDSDSNSVEFLLSIAPPSPEKKRCPPSSISPTTPVILKSSSKYSAYIQSLAEICHSILWDVRWRAKRKTLISWEQGDDLSAVLALSRSFEALPKLPTPKSYPCCDSQLNSPAIDQTAGQPKTSLDNDYEKDEVYYRSLNLYARLYFRKGPFFRVDDLYKYYLPKGKQSKLSEPLEVATKVASPSKFFLPRKQSQPKVEEKRHHHRYVDSDLLQCHMESVSMLLEDLHRLHGMGLLRTFSDEEECAKTVGVQQKYGILRQDEQQKILLLLGSKRKQGQTKTDKNFIYQQMCQQTSISSLGGDAQTILPVIKHVNKIILNSWATTIVLKASTVDYIPTSTLRSITETVESELMTLISSTCPMLPTFATCIRLREAPLKALYRCCRLYLCATSGPGSMRGEGNTAWRSLPGFHSKDLSSLPLYTNIIQPPGAQHLGYGVSYPGKDYRFKFLSCNFMRAHEPILVDPQQTSESDHDSIIQVFSSVHDFYNWELTVELRANVDYLIELNDLLHWNHNKKKRQSVNDDASSSDGDENTSSVDFLELLTREGRKKIVDAFVERANADGTTLDALNISNKVEEDVGKLLRHSEKVDAASMKGGREDTECEKIMAVIAAISVHILAASCLATPSNKIELASTRPWLRHLRWEGCLAYMLWDVIQVLEKRGCHVFAVKALEILLFGQSRLYDLSLSDATEDIKTWSQGIENNSKPSLTQILLSRRTRGKAYERLIIDFVVHILRKQEPKPQGKRKSATNEIDAKLSTMLLEICLPTGQITFSAARSLAKRIKQPLSTTLADIQSFEAFELGLRYSSDLTSERPNNKYSDWKPIVDQSVANAMASDDLSSGKRCSYIGFEENENDGLYPGSLNVEKLAMEYYKNGILPVPNTAPKGGWVGFHDEGGKVRQLWRVLSSACVLGMDFGYMDTYRPLELATIHLTPYQSAPFDLHCGAESIKRNGETFKSRGFYERRKGLIEEFLERVSRLSAQQLADFVYDCVESRHKYSLEAERSDPMLDRDIVNVRSLSMLASGIGGKMLASIFRCLFFDYRHYSGGLPDLLLMRAINSEGEVIDLGEWVGEGFLPENQKALNIFEDRDSEFLGCSKVGEAGGIPSKRFSRGGGQQKSWQQKEDDPTAVEKVQLPAKLQLHHNDKKVKVEVMFVEVKSHNDTLDPRQGDWLNILDRHGNARVCKFISPTNKRKKKVKE